jgi:iron complex transport system ATP-binding protein
MAFPLLEISHATVELHGTEVLHDLSLRVEVGEHTAILGANGSGKSTLIKLIAHQRYPHTGKAHPPSVKLFGRERWVITELRARLGVVSADLHHYFPTEWKALTGREAVLSGLLAGYDVLPHQTITAEMSERADTALALMEIEHLAQRPITRMSTGELRRTLIARALAPDPEALLLDEPTTGLDIVARQRFLETLRGVAARGKTLLLVTHHAEEILPEIARVVLLRDGRIVHDGPKEEMLTPALMEETLGAPVRVERGGNGYYTATAG